MTLLFMGILSLTFEIQPVEASETIYIKADGSVEGTTDISSVDNVTYTFTDNINDEIIIERDNIVVDGTGYTVQGTQAYDSRGINLSERSNVTIKNMTIKAFYYGIWLNYSSDNSIVGNNVTENNWYGIMLEYSSNNTISWNNITANQEGIRLYRSSNNLLRGNTIKNNGDGIVFWISCSNNRIYKSNITNNTHCNVWIQESSENVIAGNHIADSEWGIGFDYSSNNKVYHNNFAANDRQVVFINARINIWDDGYPSGGNYWSNYTGVDLLDGGDGIGDSAHVIDADNQDNYPLMGPISFFNAGTWDEVTYYVYTVSNSTVSHFHFSESNKLVSFNVTGLNDTLGFCRVAIPRELLWCEDIFDWSVRVNETSVPIRIQEDPDYTYTYFTYSHSVQNVKIYGTQVIPEFPAWTSILLTLIVLTVAIVIYKRRLETASR